MKNTKWSKIDDIMNCLCHPGCSELAKAKRANFRGDASEDQIEIIRDNDLKNIKDKSNE